MPNIKENPRNRKTPKRGRKRFFNQAIHALPARVERTFAWEDKCKRLLLRFEHIQLRHYGMKLIAYTLIDLRRFCTTKVITIYGILCLPSRRHHSWPMYSSPTCRTARWSSWI
jgi:hypothetical protein